MDRRPEVEIVPGIYITWPSGSQEAGESPRPVSPEEYISALQAQGLLIPPIIESERKRLESLTQKLEETNFELQSDPDCQVYIQENLLVIAKYRRMIALLLAVLRPSEDGLYL
jgi:small-conductance mechanosensitive channel